MDASRCGLRAVAAGAEDGDSDEDGWYIGAVQRDPQELDQMLQVDKNEALKKALVRGDVALIEELLNSGVSVETSFQFGWTPLMYAASVADFAVVRLLLDRGANACFEIDKYTVLMATCTAHSSEENVLKTVELLLSRSADPNFTCRKQMTPLMYAAKKGYPKVVALLVANGSHINAQDENGYSALIWAAQHGHKRVVLKLLELGADKNLQTKDEKTAAELAKLNKHSEIYSLLSLVANHLQGRYHATFKQEAIYNLATAVPDQGVCSYSALDDVEMVLHSLGLEHIIGLLKEKDITLRQLLRMQKDELIEIICFLVTRVFGGLNEVLEEEKILEGGIGPCETSVYSWKKTHTQKLVNALLKIGIASPIDQQKLLDASEELQVEGIRIEDLPKVMKLELSGDEVLRILQELNKECSKLTVAVQNTNKHFLKNLHKVVMFWAPAECYIRVCRELVCSVEKLGEEVVKLKDLVEKHEQRNDPSQVKLPEKSPTLEKRLVKMGAVGLLGFVFFFGTKLLVKKTLSLAL